MQEKEKKQDLAYEMTSKEISKALNIPVSSVTELYNSGMEKITKHFEGIRDYEKLDDEDSKRRNKS